MKLAVMVLLLLAMTVPAFAEPIGEMLNMPLTAAGNILGSGYKAVEGATEKAVEWTPGFDSADRFEY